MARPLSLGLQRRIMLLVTVGLALIFSIGGLLGLSAIEEATEQVFEERLATAKATVAIFQRDVDRLASDIALLSELDGASSGSDTGVAGIVFEHVGAPGRYPFFEVVGVTALDGDGRRLAQVGTTVAGALPTTDIPAPGDYVVSSATPADTEDVPFFDILVSVPAAADQGVAALVGHTVSRNRSSSFDLSLIHI